MMPDTPGHPWSSLDFGNENQGGTPSGVLDKLARGSPWMTAIKDIKANSPKASTYSSLQAFVMCMHGQPSRLCSIRTVLHLCNRSVWVLSRVIGVMASACADCGNRLCGFLQAVADIADKFADLDDLDGSLPTYDLQELPPGWKAVLSDPDVHKLAAHTLLQGARTGQTLHACQLVLEAGSWIWLSHTSP